MTDVIYAVSYKGFSVTKIGTCSGDVKKRIQTMGFVVSDDLQIATVQVSDGYAAERIAHALAERRGGYDFNAIANHVFQDVDSWQGVQLRSGYTEVFNVTFKQACRILKEAANTLNSERMFRNPLIDLSESALCVRKSTHSWNSLPVKEL